MEDCHLDIDIEYVARKNSRQTGSVRRAQKIKELLDKGGLIRKMITGPEHTLSVQDNNNQRYTDRPIVDLQQTLDSSVVAELRNGASDFCLYEPGQVYSLNKHNRWEATDQLAERLVDYQNEECGRSASYLRLAAERLPYNDRHVFEDTGGLHNPKALSYHKILPDGQQINRHPKNKTAQIVSFIQEPNSPQGSRHRYRRRINNRAAPPPPNVPHTIHIQYETVQPYPSVRKWIQRNKNVLHEEHVHRPHKRCVKLDGVHRSLADWGGRTRSFQADDWLDFDPHFTVNQVLDMCRNEHFEEIIDSDIENEPTKQLTANLSELLSLQPIKVERRRQKKRRHMKSMSEDRCWLRQLSEAPGKAGPSTDDVLDDLGEDGASSSGYASSDNPSASNRTPEPAPEFQRMQFKCYEWCLMPHELRLHYGPSYYECSSLPRRFCIDISDSVRDVYRVSTPFEKQMKHVAVESVCVFEVGCGQISDYVNAYDEEPSLSVSFWINSEIYQQQSLSISPYITNSLLDRSEAHEIETLLKASIMTLGTLPPQMYSAGTVHAMETYTELHLQAQRRQASMALRSLLAHVVSDVDFMSEDEANWMALKEADMAKRLQRQLTAVRNYSSVTNQWLLDFVVEPECEICMCSLTEDGIAQVALASCQHWFCEPCWQTHALSCLSTGRVPVMCPADRCKSILDYDTATTMLSQSQCTTYSTQLASMHQLRNKQTWIFCPAERCGRVLRRNEQQIASNVFVCECGESWCGQCAQPTHWPSSCLAHKLYKKELKAYGDEKQTRSEVDKERTVSVKRCPDCNTPMEKGYGCNHMSCRCGGQFCWACMGRWDGGSHYSCKECDRGFETIELRDVRSSSSHTYINLASYEQCIKYRRRQYSQHNIVLKGTFARTELRHFVAFAKQTNWLLEHTMVWMYFYRQSIPKQDRFVLKALSRFIGRLEFCLARCQIHIEAERLQPALDQFDYAKKLVQMFTKRISNLKIAHNEEVKIV